MPLPIPLIFQERIRDMWLKDGLMERLEYKKDVRTIREVGVYVQRDRHLQQASDAQFLVHCKPGSPRGLVSQVATLPTSPAVDTDAVVVTSSMLGERSVHESTTESATSTAKNAVNIGVPRKFTAPDYR